MVPPHRRRFDGRSPAAATVDGIYALVAAAEGGGSALRT
jgi:hypothetical protein